jgi:hypothetical protein
MPSIINATTTAGVAVTGDNSGVLTLQTNSGTSALSISTGQQLQVHTAGSASAPVISKSDDTNTGVYFSAADTVDIATGGTAAFQLDSSQNLKFNSGYGSVATAYGCRAWVNFNGTGTVAIRASGNVSSITDNGTGDYTVNFTNAMPNANYAFTQHITCSSSGAINDGCDLQSIATGSFRVLCGNGGTSLDADYAMFSVFR